MAVTLPISPISHKLCRSSRFGNNGSTPRFCSPIFSISPCLIGSASELRARLPLVSSAVATNSILHDVGATVAVLGGAYALVLSFENLTKRNMIPQVSLSFLFNHTILLIILLNSELFEITSSVLLLDSSCVCRISKLIIINRNK